MSENTIWSLDDHQAAEAEGWGIYTGNGDFPFVLAAKRSESQAADETIWLRVYDRAVAGCALARRALDFLLTKSRPEFEAIRRYLAIYRPHEIVLS